MRKGSEQAAHRERDCGADGGAGATGGDVVEGVDV